MDRQEREAREWEQRFVTKIFESINHTTRKCEEDFVHVREPNRWLATKLLYEEKGK